MNFIEQAEKILNQKQGKRKEVIESMVRGMKRYIGSSNYQGTNAPLELLSHMEKRLEEVS